MFTISLLYYIHSVAGQGKRRVTIDTTCSLDGQRSPFYILYSRDRRHYQYMQYCRYRRASSCPHPGISGTAFYPNQQTRAPGMQECTAEPSPQNTRSRKHNKQFTNSQIKFLIATTVALHIRIYSSKRQPSTSLALQTNSSTSTSLLTLHYIYPNPGVTFTLLKE